MAYHVYDFSESLARVDEFKKNDVAECLAVWGEQGDYCEWDGGFFLRLKDERYAYLTGWCDTTGWGCQDGVQVTLYDNCPDRPDADRQWDEFPVDLNRYLRGEIGEFDDE